MLRFAAVLTLLVCAAVSSVRAAPVEQPAATATANNTAADPRVALLKLLPAGTKPEPGTIYELAYAARDPVLLGLGFAATATGLDPGIAAGFTAGAGAPGAGLAAVETPAAFGAGLS